MTTVAPDKQRIQHALITFDFKTLFVEELGWDILREAPLTISVDGQTYILRPLVEKRGFKVYTCTQDTANVLTSTTMRQIERELTTHAYEHLIIYTDAACTQQVWQWVKREPGKPSATRLYRLHKGQSGELLAQKLLSLAFSIEEEEQLGTTAVAARVRQALDAERVTRKFYDRFQKEHTTFLDFIEGIVDQGDREWYASLMLNRLMFVYFIQKKGLLDTTRRDALDGDHHYLTHKLREMQGHYGEDQFYSFYRYFLLKLFHDGLGQGDRSPELVQLLGNVPYLNGGLFDVHLLERDYPAIQIADEAFERIFGFFDEFDWHLDDRPLRNDREINPDVLGYIFEKYINQKQMGAYYTKEDITEYIGKNAIIPRLLEVTQQQCSAAFIPDGFVWSLLRRDPDRYLYDALKKGSDLPLPPEIARGLRDVSQRREWNTLAPATYALPTETWREVMMRRNRYEGIRAKLAQGTITSVNDLITYNLNILQLAQDIIAYSEGPELLSAFYEALEQITILDPTCGSGAFLFAALTILEPLYEACLDRMQELVAERDLLDSRDPQQREAIPDSPIARFRDILAQIAEHPNRRYFILKAIIIHNLYGVDIMEEAVEICKLRLFLKLVAQIDRFDDIEPLPDIDFNIRAGNTLVGFATYAEAERAITSKLDFDNTMEQIRIKAQAVEQRFARFQAMQTAKESTSHQLADAKEQLRSHLRALNTELNSYLAAEYGIDRSHVRQQDAYAERFMRWQQSHQPFHWFVEFYSIMKKGGFDVVIGNPPYVDYSKVRNHYIIRGYETEACGNLYAYVAERCFKVINQRGKVGLIVMLNLAFADGFSSLRQEIIKRTSNIWLSLYDNIPDGLFAGSAKTDSPNTNKVVSQRVCILLCDTSVSQNPCLHSSHFLRWNRDFRAFLFPTLAYGSIKTTKGETWPALGSPLAVSIYDKLRRTEDFPLENLILPSGLEFLQLGATPRYFISAVPEQLNRSGLIELRFRDLHSREVAECILNSMLFYWYWRATGDGFHLTRSSISAFPVSRSLMKDREGVDALVQALAKVRDKCRTSKLNKGMMVYNVNYNLSPQTLTAVDRFLSGQYMLTEEEADFIINYDVKYRILMNLTDNSGEE